MKTTSLSIATPIATPDEGDNVIGFLLLRGKTYHFRRKVPSELRIYFPDGYREISRSLATTDKRSAVSSAREWLVKTDRLFSFLRSGIADVMKSEYLKTELALSPITATASTKKQPAGKKVSDLINAYVRSKTGAGDWTLKTKQEVEFAIQLFIDVMGDMSLSKLNFTVIETYREKLQQIPADHTRLKIYKSLTIQEILDLPTDSKELPKPKTVNKKLGFFSTLLDFGVQRDMLLKNPAIGIRVKELGVSLPSDQKPHYSDEDIQDIIHRLHFAPSNPARFFVPLLAIFTGARRRELCQLYLSDIREVDGIPCLDINGLGDTVIHTPKTGKGKGIPQQLPEKRLKYPASWRLVPINPVLWYELGFGGFVEECRTVGQKKLFPELGTHRDGPGTAFSKWYDVEIAPHVAGAEDQKKTFHSFRHSIQTWYKHRQLEGLERGFANEILKEVIGHAYNKSGAEDLSKERYGKKYPPELTSKLLFQLDYGLNFDNICEQVGNLNKFINVVEKKRSLNPDFEYPSEDNREQ